MLDTVHRTATGSVRVTDLMPFGDGRADLLRVVEGLEGEVEMVHEWVVRPSYGAVVPWVSRTTSPDGVPVIRAVAGPDMLVLRGTRLPRASDHLHRDTFAVRSGERLEFATTWVPSWASAPTTLDIDPRIRHTVATFEEWSGRCRHVGPYAEAVHRSLLVLRLLTDETAAASSPRPPPRLPEDVGGERNWDYRFCWLRDASLTLEALLAAGYVGETRLWRDWLVRAVAGDPADLQIMYAVDGGRELPERELGHLPGYAGSRPVRVGNGAAEQRQSDVLGEVMMALEAARRLGLKETPETWAVQRALVEELADHWDQPDHGLWEIRGPMRHFTHSRVLVWAAVDASLLLIPRAGFLAADDPRVLGTLAAVEEDLLRDGFLLRYRTSTGVDGLPGDENPFLACSWWLVEAYARSGRPAEATALMDRLVGVLNDVGLVSEEYDPRTGALLGNFPQAFSHLSLIQAALAIRDAGAVAEPDAGR